MKNGYTLIEIIVVIVIMSLFIGTGFVVYSRNIQKNLLDKEADEFLNVVRLTHNRATSRDLTGKPASCTNTNFGGYNIRLLNDNRSYRQQFKCLSPATNTNLTPIHQLDNVTFTAGVGTSIPFYYPNGCTTANCTGSDQIITIKNTAIKKCIDITITSSGNISSSEQVGC